MVGRSCSFLLAAFVVVGSVLHLGTVAVAGQKKQGADDLERSLAVVRARIASLSAKLESLKKAVKTQEAERKKLALELEVARNRVEEAKLLLAGRQREVDRVRAEVKRLGDEMAKRRRVLEASIHLGLLLGRPGRLRLLLDAASGGDLLRAVDVSGALGAGITKLWREYEELRAERSRKLAELSERLEEAAEKARLLERRRTELALLKKKVEQRLRQLKWKEKKAREALVDLKRRKEAMERLLGILAARSTLPPKENIRRYFGALPWPCQGALIVHFGKRKLKGYDAYVVSNGIRMAAPQGTEVTAVFPGEVVYASFFKGYGNTVVVDHGHGVMTVTAGLATMFVEAGRRVRMGEALGLAGPVTQDGNVYFEVRVNAKPVDPLRVLKLRAAGGDR